jgi:hypothetical protein
MFTHVKNFISIEDIAVVNEYIKTVKFNTKEDHDPLHDSLYKEYNAPFDLHTRGEMPQHILEIFSKYSKGFYELVSEVNGLDYMPPMFSKHYIARYTSGKSLGPQFDKSKPENTYKSIIFWNNDFQGGSLEFPNLGKSFRPEPGDLVYFIESEENKCAILEITNGDLYLSEAWIGLRGQLWMPSSVPYEQIEWDNWEIKGF